MKKVNVAYSITKSIALIAVAFLFIYCIRHNDTRYKEWADYGGAPDQSKYVALEQINKENIKQLEVAFVYPTNDNNGYRFNPVVVDGIMYVLAKDNSLVAINAETGKELWIHANLKGIIQRGVNFWQSKDKKEKRLLICLNNTLQAIDANTGKSITTFGEKGYVDLKLDLDRDPDDIGRAMSTTPGKVFEDLILLGSAPGENLFSGPGHLRAYNVRTGKRAWIFHTIPHPGEYGYESWPKDAYKYVGGTNTWGEISVDADRGIAYFPIGSPTYDYDGADRTGDNLFGNCILALDARTGKRLWHFQTVHHDIWDYDLTAAPQLVTITHEGQKRDVVAVASKNGFLYVLDRVTGKPIWPIEERPVPKSDMPDEKASPTQPFPTVLPPFNRQIVSANDVNPFFSKEEKEKWVNRILAAKNGLYQPLSSQYEIVTTPGAVGGVNYGNTAANPAKGIVYLQTQELPDFYKLNKKEAKSAQTFDPSRLHGQNNSSSELGKALFVKNCQVCHGANLLGLPGLGTSLTDLKKKMNQDGFKAVLVTGKGRMPPFASLSDKEVADIYNFLTQTAGQGKTEGKPTITGPVVASGGVNVTRSQPVRSRMSDYPKGYTGAKVQYVEANLWGLGVPNLLSPPWSSILAYDLNEGKIKWSRPLGKVDSIPDGEKYGMPNGSQGKGMIVTSNGIIFSTCLDGRVYAYDADNGNLIWTAELGRTNPGGIPAMYQVNGRQYLVVCSVGEKRDKTIPDDQVMPKGYVVYALPQKNSH